MRRRELVPAILLVVATAICAVLTPHFLDLRYLLDRSTLYVETGLLALGMTLVIVSGNIDLSVGSNLTLTGCLVAKLVEKGAGVGEAVVAGIVIGAALGAFNGFLVAKLKLPSFLVTLGTMAAYRGAAQAMLGSEGIKLPAGFKGIDQSYIAGLPWPLLILILLAAITGVLLHGTVLGRWVFALGTNESASRYSGVPVDRVKVLSFALMGLLCGVAALLADSRLAVARHDIAAGIELDAITVAVVGGTAISGGVGSILGTVLSLFLIGVIKTGMGVAGVKAEYQLTVIGVLLIGAALSGQIATWAFSRVRRIEPGKT